MGWDVSDYMRLSVPRPYVITLRSGMGTLHAWEKYGDGVAPDIQAVAKGLGGGYDDWFRLNHSSTF